MIEYPDEEFVNNDDLGSGVEVALAESQTKDEYDGRPLIF